MRQLQERWEFEAGRWGFHEGKLQPGLQEPVFFRGADTGQLAEAGRKREEMEQARDDEMMRRYREMKGWVAGYDIRRLRNRKQICVPASVLLCECATASKQPGNAIPAQASSRIWAHVSLAEAPRWHPGAVPWEDVQVEPPCSLPPPCKLDDKTARAALCCVVLSELCTAWCVLSCSMRRGGSEHGGPTCMLQVLSCGFSSGIQSRPSQVTLIGHG
ncbi:hypothetical protein Q7C36_000897 [Tachysurus vachellii]|uniref:Uncharacterized protein n=1 Tax=Tachysurus vachellii TaxID=175792 RepID=A0AA88P022_TACVA|nr:hypothetical protein Q7C36_000897 [Tachysurus vachellii]